MRVWELSTGILTPLTNEENDLLNKMMEDEKTVLSDREEILAQSLLQKGALIREETEETYIFKVKYKTDTWRD